MEVATLLGTILAMAFILGAILTGASPLIFINIPSLLIVVGGTFSVLLMRFTFPDIKNLGKVIGNAFKKPSYSQPQEVIQKFIELSNISRREGILALEKQQIDDPFLQKGINYCVDGAEAEKIEEIMSKEIEYLEARHSGGAQILDATGDAAPAFGMVGTLIGLVQMLSAMDDPKSIGPAMAVALLTTLYGAIIANALAIPLKDKLDIKTADEVLTKEIIKSGVLGIHHGENPRLLGETLESFIKPSLRTGGEGGEGD